MNNLMNVAALVTALLATSAAAQQFELKGIRWGTKEADFKKTHPKARCGDTGNKKDLVPGELGSRLCTLQGFTVAGQATTDARFLFINGELQSMGFFLYEFALFDLKDSVVAKHGPPTSKTHESLTWQLKDAHLYILTLSDRIAFDITSPAALAHQSRVRSQSAKRGAADL